MESLNRLFEAIENKIDLSRCAEIDERYRKVLACEPVDRPPLVIACEEHPLGLKPFGHNEVYDDPDKMLFNMLLTRVYPCLDFEDDGPLAIRADMGTVVVASILGCRWRLTEDMPPWVDPVRELRQVERIVEAGVPDVTTGWGARVLETMRFYREKLADYPRCRRAVQIAMPDAQGPFDTAEMICGSNIFYHLHDEPELIGRLFALVGRTMVAYAKRTKELAIDRLSPGLTCQHGYMIPGEILIRDDSIINISREMYETIVRPHDEYVLAEMGTGSIHFCGNGQHQIDALLEIGPLRGLDLGQPEMMDVEEIYRKCAVRGVPVTNLTPSADDLVSGRARRAFPTGAVFVYQAQTLAEAREVMAGYRKEPSNGKTETVPVGT